MANPPTLRYTCKACGSPVRIKVPQQPRTITFPCPHCQTPATVKLPGIEQVKAQIAARAAAAQSAPSAPPAHKAQPVGSPKPTYIVNNPANTPVAARPTPPPAPAPHPAQAPNPYFSPAPPQAFAGSAPTQPWKPAASRCARLVKIGKIVNKDYPLCEGTVVIGRDDANVPSDIAIKDDPYISRRSISIETMREPSGSYAFRLRVLKTTNPVKLNDMALGTGTDTFLNFGDIITLGHTKFRLEPGK